MQIASPAFTLLCPAALAPPPQHDAVVLHAARILDVTAGKTRTPGEALKDITALGHVQFVMKNGEVIQR